MTRSPYAAEVDLGFNVWLKVPLRLAGIAARELREPGGPEARDNLARLLPTGSEVLVRSRKPGRPVGTEKFGRWLAVVILPDGVDLCSLLVMTNWAAVWDGKGVQPKPPWPRPWEAG